MIICLGFASVLLLGCASSPERWGREQIEITSPQVAYLGEDGRLLLGFYIEREKQPRYTGWHWLIAEPGLSAQALAPLGDERQPGAWYEASFSFYHFYARFEPPVLEPGLPDDTPPTAHGQLTPLGLYLDEKYDRYRLAPMDATSEPRTPLMTFTPAVVIYQSDEDARRQANFRLLTSPIRFVGTILATPIRWVAWRRFMRNLDF